MQEVNAVANATVDGEMLKIGANKTTADGGQLCFWTFYYAVLFLWKFGPHMN